MALNFKDIDDLVLLKPDGVFQIQRDGDRYVIAVHRFGQPDEFITCLSAGDANRRRMELTDAGMTGLIGDAL
ncbi:hypothetical protein [Paracoccus spongiarum]|uniref:Uncharacterized protein n=1 Tax=Paracoccus spongiarum TaxID=3064387 RepID=A0ABT9J983_9RHOB|nr:hypothetical protein [Paracoccus sp. 2205BS29-5]MDP5306382.1 hypothetical protein [Paracoccus sp. 2205BS29-5]